MRLLERERELIWRLWCKILWGESARVRLGKDRIGGRSREEGFLDFVEGCWHEDIVEFLLGW